MSDEDEQRLRALIANWLRDNPDQWRSVAFYRLSEFAEQLMRSETTGGGLFGGVRRTLSEVEETRLMAERNIFFLQRLPLLLSWNFEMLSEEIADGDLLQGALADASRLADAMSVLADQTEQLPQEVDELTSRTLDRVDRLLDRQREALVGILESSDPQLQATLGDVRATIESANDATVEAGSLVAALDTLTDKLDLTPRASEPLDLVEVRATLADLQAVVAHTTELTESTTRLLTVLEDGLPELQAFLGETEKSGEQLASHIFRLAAFLILLFFAAALLASVVYRRLGRRSGAAGPTSP